MVQKNQEICEYVNMLAVLIYYKLFPYFTLSKMSLKQKYQKFQLLIFFASLSCHYGFTNYLKILDFAFFNIIPTGVSTCKILTFQDQYFRKYKVQEIVKFSFQPFRLIFFFNFALKTSGTLKMFLLSTETNFYFKLSSYVEGHMEKILTVIVIHLVLKNQER